MPRPRNIIPTYRLHRQSGRAIVKYFDLAGAPHERLMPGPYDSPESRLAYKQFVLEYQANGPAGLLKAETKDVSVNELLLAYFTFAKGYYCPGEADSIRLSLKPVRQLYGMTPAAEFGPLRLKAVREDMIRAGLARKNINLRIGRIRRAWKWAASEEMIPHTAYAALTSVVGLAPGRTPAKETKPVQPAPEADVEAVLPFVLAPVRAMIQLQRVTGSRPGEVVRLRPMDIDTSAAVWLFKPPAHKNTWRGKGRVIPIGPRGQTILKPLLDVATDAYVFPTRRGRYSVRSYCRAVHRGCRRAGVPLWHPNQLRHSHGTTVRAVFGLEAAQVSLGHSKANTTEIYAERDLSLALKVAREIG